MAIEFGLLILAAYLLGSVPAAYIAAKLSRGIDIRRFSDGNVGASNLLRITSKQVAIPVIIFDLGKGIVMVWAAQLVGLGVAQQVTVGLATIIGHNWPVFLRFSGGKGLLTTLGLALILPLINNLVPWGIVAFLAIMAIALLALHTTPLGMLAGIAALPLVSWGFGEPFPLTLGFLAMFLIMVLRRLTAPRTSFSASETTGQLLVNRLLFDRDIRDGKAWIKRNLPEQQEKRREG